MRSFLIYYLSLEYYIGYVSTKLLLPCIFNLPVVRGNRILLINQQSKDQGPANH